MNTNQKHAIIIEPVCHSLGLVKYFRNLFPATYSCPYSCQIVTVYLGVKGFFQYFIPLLPTFFCLIIWFRHCPQHDPLDLSFQSTFFSFKPFFGHKPLHFNLFFNYFGTAHFLYYIWVSFFSFLPNLFGHGPPSLSFSATCDTKGELSKHLRP